MDIPVKSRSMRSYHVLEVMGKPVYASVERMRDAIAKRLGDKHARLFAIPRPSDDGDSMEWYVEGEGEVVSWSDATPAQRKLMADQIDEMLPGLKELANMPAGGGDVAGEEVRQLLRQAMFVPERMENVFLVGGEPVVTFWGFVTHDMNGDNDVLSRLHEEYTGAAHGENASGHGVGQEPRGLRKGWVAGSVFAVLALAASGAFLVDRMREDGRPSALAVHDMPQPPLAQPPKPEVDVQMQEPAKVDVQAEVTETAVAVLAPETSPAAVVQPEVPERILQLYEAGQRQVRQGDFVEALDTLKRAADEGYAEAMAAYADLRDPVVARLAGRPLGVANGDEALHYYQKALDAGLSGVAERRDRLAEYIEEGQGPVGGGYRNEAW